MATRRKTANQENTVTENENIEQSDAPTTEVDAPAPVTADYADPTEANPEHDVVDEVQEIPVPEGASRAHGAAIKRLNDNRRRLTKLDARAAKAEKEYRETQELLNSKRPALVAAVAEAQVDVEYHQNRKDAVDKALAGAQARAAGHPEDAPDNRGDDTDDVIDSLDDAKAVPTNAGHVEFTE